MTNKNHAPRYAYIAPTYSQAKKIAWDYLKFYTEKIPGTKYNETELRCDLINGARISLLSSENPDSIRGIGLDACVIDEAASCNQNLIDEDEQQYLQKRARLENEANVSGSANQGKIIRDNSNTILLFEDPWKNQLQEDEESKIVYDLRVKKLKTDDTLNKILQRNFREL